MRPRSNAVSYPRQSGRPHPRPASQISTTQSRPQSQSLEAGPSFNARGSYSFTPSSANPNIFGNGRAYEIRPWASRLQSVPSLSTIQSSGSSRSVGVLSPGPCSTEVNETPDAGIVSQQGLPVSESFVNGPGVNQWKKSHPVAASTVCAEEISQKMSDMLAFQETLKPSQARTKPQSASTISRLVPQRVINKVSGVWGKLHGKSSEEEGYTRSKPDDKAIHAQLDGRAVALQRGHDASMKSISSIEIRLNEGDNLNIRKVQQITGGGVNRKPFADEGRLIRGGRRATVASAGLRREQDQTFAVQPPHHRVHANLEHMRLRSPDFDPYTAIHGEDRDRVGREYEEAEVFTFPESGPSGTGSEVLNEIPYAPQYRSSESRDRIRIHHSHARRGHGLAHQAQNAHYYMPSSDHPRSGQDHGFAHQYHANQERVDAHPNLVGYGHQESGRRGHAGVPSDNVHRQLMSAVSNHIARVQMLAQAPRGNQRANPSPQARSHHRRMPAMDGQDLRDQMLLHHSHRTRANDHIHQGIGRALPVREPRIRFQLSHDVETRSRQRMTSSHGPFDLEAGFEENLNDGILSTLPVGSSTPREAALVIERSKFKDYHQSRRGSLPASDHIVLSSEDVCVFDSTDTESTNSRSLMSHEDREDAFEKIEAPEDDVFEDSDYHAIEETDDLGDFEGGIEESEDEEVEDPPPEAPQAPVLSDGDIRRKAGMKKHPSPSKEALEELSKVFQHYYYFKKRGAGQAIDVLAERWHATSKIATEMQTRLEQCRLSTADSIATLASVSSSQSVTRNPFASENEDDERPVGHLPPASRFDQVPKLSHAGPSLKSRRAVKNGGQL